MSSVAIVIFVLCIGILYWLAKDAGELHITEVPYDSKPIDPDHLREPDWIDLVEYYPKKSGIYLVITEKNNSGIGYYDSETRAFSIMYGPDINEYIKFWTIIEKENKE